MKIEWSLPDRTLEAGSGEPFGSIATLLVRLAEAFTYFHDSQKRAFVRLKVKDHDEVYPVKSTSFRYLLAREYYKRVKKAANRDAIADASWSCKDAPYTTATNCPCTFAWCHIRGIF